MEHDGAVGHCVHYVGLTPKKWQPHRLNKTHEL